MPPWQWPSSGDLWWLIIGDCTIVLLYYPDLSRSIQIYPVWGLSLWHNGAPRKKTVKKLEINYIIFSSTEALQELPPSAFRVLRHRQWRAKGQKICTLAACGVHGIDICSGFHTDRRIRQEECPRTALRQLVEGFGLFRRLPSVFRMGPGTSGCTVGVCHEAKLVLCSTQWHGRLIQIAQDISVHDDGTRIFSQARTFVKSLFLRPKVQIATIFPPKALIHDITAREIGAHSSDGFEVLVDALDHVRQFAETRHCRHSHGSRLILAECWDHTTWTWTCQTNNHTKQKLLSCTRALVLFMCSLPGPFGVSFGRPDSQQIAEEQLSLANCPQGRPAISWVKNLASVRFLNWSFDSWNQNGTSQRSQHPDPILSKRASRYLKICGDLIYVKMCGTLDPEFYPVFKTPAGLYHWGWSPHDQPRSLKISNLNRGNDDQPSILGVPVQNSLSFRYSGCSNGIPILAYD